MSALQNELIRRASDLEFLDTKDQDWISTIFSSHTGIINGILKRNELDAYGLEMYQALSAQTKILFDTDRDVSSGGLGVDFSASNALYSCIGESIERYCMSYVPTDDLLLAHYDDVPLEHRLDCLSFYTDQQYETHADRFSNPSNHPIYWCKVYSNRSSHFIYYPASLVYLPFGLQKPVAETSSTGVSAHTTIEQAVLSGTLEVIERDALMVNFFQKLPRRSVDLASILENISTTHADFIKNIQSNFQIKVFHLHSDLNVPIYLSYIWTDADEAPLHYGIGACAHLNSEDAIIKSLKECLFTYFYSKKLLHLKKTDKNAISSLYEHFLYYQDDKFYKLCDNAVVSSYSSHSLQERQLFESLEKAGLFTYYIDLTTKDIQSFTPLKVVKVVIPSMIDLNKTHGLLRRAAKRFETVPKTLNFNIHEPDDTEPHPFP